MTERASRALLVVLGLLLVQYASIIPNYGTSIAGTTITTALLATALLTLLAAATTTTPTWQSQVFAAGALATCSIAGLWIAATATGPTTDAFNFTQYAGNLFLEGTNPYHISMQPAFSEYGREPLRPTYRVDGSIVTTYSYPAASIVYGALGAALTSVTPNAFYVLLSAFLSAAAVLIYLELPSDLATLAPISFLAAGNLWLSTAGGIIDAIWLLPLVATMAAWHRDRLYIAGLCFGLAVAAKQQPWLIAPAALIVLYRTAPPTQRFNRPARFAAPAAGVFTLTNAPFLISHPVAWLEGVFVAVDITKPSIIQDGIGIVALSTSGTLPLPSSLLGVATPLVAAAAYVIIYWQPAKTQHAIWLLPPIVLFWSPRSLTSYFTMFAPVAALAVGHYTESKHNDA